MTNPIFIFNKFNPIFYTMLIELFKGMNELSVEILIILVILVYDVNYY